MLQTYGRSGQYNPHIHVIMSSGGLNQLIDELYKKYPLGFVANISKGEAPKKAIKVETVDVMTFVGRMVQHILPKGFKRVRY